MKVKIKNTSGFDLPRYQTDGAAGMDLRAAIEEEIVIAPGKRQLIPTGLFLEIPNGYEAQVRSRSGLALKSGVAVLNSPGTIDADYRGEVGVILINHSESVFAVKPGDRVAQLVFARHERAEWEEVNELNETERGAGGFGHTGKN